MAGRSEQELALLYRAEDHTSPVQDKVRAGVERTEAAVEKSTSKMKLAKEAIGALAGAATGLLVGALSEASRAAVEDAASTEMLHAAVEKLGDNLDRVGPSIEKRIALGQQLAFSDDMTRDSLTKLLTVTQSTEEAIELNTLAMDISRAKKIDLAAATDIVVKAQMGMTGSLRRAGIELADGATKTEALAALQEKFGGAAERYAGTQAAAIFRVKDAVDEWKESIGASLGPLTEYVAMLPGLTPMLLAVSSGLGHVIPKVAALTLSLWAHVPAAIAAAAPYLALVAAAGLVVIALWQVAETIGVVIDNWDKVTYVVGNAVEDLKRSAARMFDGFAQFGRQLVEGLARGVADNWHLLLGPLGGLARGAVETVQRIWQSRSPSEVMIDEGANFAVGVAEGIKRRTPEVVRMARLLAAEGVQGTKTVLMDLAETMVVPAAVAVGTAIPTGIAAGIRASSAIDDALREKLERLRQQASSAMEQFTSSVGFIGGTFGPGGQIVAGAPTPAGVAPGTGVAGQTRYDPATGTIYYANGTIGRVPVGSAPRAWIPGGASGPVPIFHQGGVMPHDGLALLERGERVIPRGGAGGQVQIHVEVHGSVIGLPQIEQKVREAVAQGVARGAFRGLLATETG